MNFVDFNCAVSMWFYFLVMWRFMLRFREVCSLQRCLTPIFEYNRPKSIVLLFFPFLFLGGNQRGIYIYIFIYLYIYIQLCSCLYLHLFFRYYIFTYNILHVYFVYMAYIHLFIFDPLCIAGGPVKLRRWSSWKWKWILGYWLSFLDATAGGRALD